LTVVGHLVAGLAELGERRGCIRQLGLLHQQDIGAARSTHQMTFSKQALREFTFQVAIRMT